MRNWFVCLCCLAGLCSAPALSDNKADLIRRWNLEKDRTIKLTPETVLIRESKAERFPGLLVAGFKQSDGTYSLGRIVWRSQTFTPLKGFGQILADSGFQDLDDAERRRLFLELLQQTYGVLGTKPYTGKASRRANRPRPMADMRLPTDGHRFQVWFYDYPVTTEEGEWREVLYTVSPDGNQVKAHMLGSYHPLGERLRDFPSISSELFE
ncbi:MAG TPA: hypothetical protein EYO33_16635 [Phycisphaerales bacterium]|nr:hypothetical protein [Phycisphaerales bacterium]